ncbi:unnamed protein product, partial [Polarella glacialis]
MAEYEETAEDGVASGEELFKSLLRIFPLATPWDYFKNGRWQVELLQIDTDLVEAHRREAAAPEPPPLEE